eukprot:GHVS01048353.1.p1 GENE.GHVS01048353.1~~GHVS01048353.1.p1  ORF type:complete len:247 (+),score=35.56 GHVS01048353.1:122-862(+)
MGNVCQRHTTGPSPECFSASMIPSPTDLPSPQPSPSSAASSSVGRSAGDTSQGEGEGITSLTVEHSSTSCYPTSVATLSVTSDTTRTCSPSSKPKNGTEASLPSRAAPSSVVRQFASFSGASTATRAKSLSNVSLEPGVQHRLRLFYARNLRAQKRHATVMAQQRLSVHTCDSSSSSGDRVDLYDVFSPDERSTRWSEFQELLARSKQEYTSYRNATKIVRGNNKAMTIAGVRPNPNPAGQLPIMH